MDISFIFYILSCRPTLCHRVPTSGPRIGLGGRFWEPSLGFEPDPLPGPIVAPGGPNIVRTPRAGLILLSDLRSAQERIRVFNILFIDASFFERMVVEYLRAAAPGATSGNTVMFYLGGFGRPGFNTWALTTSEGPGHEHARHALNNLA
jgi:hypothetical protein